MTNGEWLRLTGSVPTTKPLNRLLQLRLWEISLCFQTLGIKVTEVTSKALTSLPSHIGLAGDYVLVVEDETDEDRDEVTSQIRLFNWKTYRKEKESRAHPIGGFESDLQQQALESSHPILNGSAPDLVSEGSRWISLPEELLPTIYVSLFPEYLTSIGVCDDDRIHLQVLAFPLAPHPGMKNSTAQDRVSSGFVLAANILLMDSYDHPNWEPKVCHKYIGRYENHMVIWIPEDEPLPMWHVFEFNIDFRKSPEQWFSRTTTLEPQLGDEAKDKVLSKRTVYDTTSDHWDLPLIDGKQFFSVEEGNGLIFLSLFHLDNIPPMEDALSFETESEADAYHLEQVERYPKKVLESPLWYPSCDPDPVSLLGFDFREWGGTASLFMSNGDIWVLRYGHA